MIVTRDDGDVAPKPAPDGVLHAAAVMGVPPEETLVVGDFLLDMQAGRAAGAVTAHLLNHGLPAFEHEEQPDAADCDFVVGRLADLDGVVRLGLPLAPGKLPNDLLAGFLGGLAADDPSLVVPPAVGEDVAALDLAGAELLVAHGDPITLGGADVGAAAVLINVNDIAAAGAEPRWLLATVLLPAGTTPSEAQTLLAGLAEAAARSGATLAGGHTEVTAVVNRPVVSLTALGTVGRAELKEKRSARTGDRVLLTKALAMEGTALLADELAERLLALGMSVDELAACRGLQERTSVLAEARLARVVAGVRAMHDVTEGGLATALRELAAATGRGVRVHRERVPVAPETSRVCSLLGADPLGLIASGSLLICCDPAGAAALAGALEAAGIPAADIGELTEDGPGVVALERDLPAPWPSSRPTRPRACSPPRADLRKTPESAAGRAASSAALVQSAVSCQSMFISSQSPPSCSRNSATWVVAGTKSAGSHLEQRRVGVRRRPSSDESTLSMLTPSSPSRCNTNCMRPGWSMAQVLSLKGSAGERRSARVRRPQLRVHVAVAAQGAEAVLQAAHRLLAAGHQHHHGELAAQVDHAAVPREDYPALGDIVRHRVDQPGAVVADGGEHGVVCGLHGGDGTASHAGSKVLIRGPADPHLLGRRPARPGACPVFTSGLAPLEVELKV